MGKSYKKTYSKWMLCIIMTFMVVVIGIVTPGTTAYARITTCTMSTNTNVYVNKPEGKWYTYCPVAVKNGNSTTTFYCKNGVEGQIVDYIYSTTKAPKQKTRSRIALQPSNDPERFDSVHVCDPTVVSGKYTYQNKSYKYAMFYLGSQTLDNQCNRIGVALSNNLNGKFIKPENKVVIDYVYDNERPDVFQWGAGQPSAISLGNGKVLLFYTKGDASGTDTYASLIDMASIEDIQILWTAKFSSEGAGSFISNADFAYDSEEKRLYMVCDKRPFADGTLNIVADTSVLYFADTELDMESLESCTWNFMRNIDVSVTGHKRNHNCGFIRDTAGFVSGKPPVLCTVADNSLWEYRIKLIE